VARCGGRHNCRLLQSLGKCITHETCIVTHKLNSLCGVCWLVRNDGAAPGDSRTAQSVIQHPLWAAVILTHYNTGHQRGSERSSTTPTLSATMPPSRAAGCMPIMRLKCDLLP
jgi:hypothetical protein